MNATTTTKTYTLILRLVIGSAGLLQVLGAAFRQHIPPEQVRRYAYA